MLAAPDNHLDTEIDKLDNFLVALREEARKNLDVSVQSAEDVLVRSPLGKPNAAALKKVLAVEP